MSETTPPFICSFARVRKFLGYITVLALVGVLQGCSWIEQFVIYNRSDKAIYISYELLQNGGTFPIFDDKPVVHALNSLGDIDWNKTEYVLNDEDSEINKVKMAIPPHSALMFGSLHNDKYERYDQTFINGRVFNLLKLQILYNNKSLDIVPSTFDQYFKKRKGNIRFTVE